MACCRKKYFGMWVLLLFSAGSGAMAQPAASAEAIRFDCRVTNSGLLGSGFSERFCAFLAEDLRRKSVGQVIADGAGKAGSHLRIRVDVETKTLATVTMSAGGRTQTTQLSSHDGPLTVGSAMALTYPAAVLLGRAK